MQHVERITAIFFIHFWYKLYPVAYGYFSHAFFCVLKWVKNRQICKHNN